MTSHVNGRGGGSEAPWYRIPRKTIVNVEHPGIVHSLEKTIKTLGGPQSLKELVSERNEAPAASLYLRPDDHTNHPITADPVRSEDVLLRVTLSKRTGRKRKRGSAEPYQPDESIRRARKDAQYYLRSMRDCPSSYRVETVGAVQRTYRFRALSDFQHSTENSPFMNKMRDTLLQYDYPKLKNFRLDPSRGVKSPEDLIPPPTITPQTVPFNYSYLQNPAVKFALDATGKAVLTNLSTAQKILTVMVTHDDAEIPTTYNPQLPDLRTQDPKVQRTVHRVEELMQERPIWTRRALGNQLDDNTETINKASFQYVGYMFRSGPWREALVRFGVDPRTDAKYRIYQTMMFQISTKDAERGQTKWEEERTKYRRSKRGKMREMTSHIFDGKGICLDGKVWQVCDITDPILAHLLATTNLRPECDTRYDGWYQNGTWAKVKTIMKEKVKALIGGRQTSTVDLAKLLQLPDIINDATRDQTVLPRGANAREIEMATEIRVKASHGMSQAQIHAPRHGPASRARWRPGGPGDVGGESPGAHLPDAAAAGRHEARVEEAMEAFGRAGMDVEDVSEDDEEDEDEEDEDEDDDDDDVDEGVHDGGMEIEDGEDDGEDVDGDDDDQT
ncbi:MAG: tau 95 subunit of transcription factor TFIIIC [Thelocarpon superellum]|nr:MAG: tau 95 subunit of transcription factor TFIIIC [Thelocarpon superellum]